MSVDKFKIKVQNRADSKRDVSMTAVAYHNLSSIDLLNMGVDYTGNTRTWLIRMSAEEAEEYANNILKAVEALRSKADE